MYDRLAECLHATKVNHDKQIMALQTLKDAHVYCVVNRIPSQKYGSLIEKYIIKKYNFTKNNPSDAIGDCSKHHMNVEIKTSLGGASRKKFNFVQIRISQNVSTYILTAYHLTFDNLNDGGDLYVFRIPKCRMKELIVKYGMYAHGTTQKNGKISMESLCDVTNMKEYALRPSYGSKCWNELVKFRTNIISHVHLCQ